MHRHSENDMKKILICFLSLLLILAAAEYPTLNVSAERLGEEFYSPETSLAENLDNFETLGLTVREGLKSHLEKIELEFTMDENFYDELEAFVRDLIDYALLHTGEPDEGDYLRFQYGGYKAEYGYQTRGGAYDYYVTLEPVYYTDIEQEEKISDKVSEIITELDFSDSATDLEKITAIHNYLVENISYDHVHADNPYHTLKVTAYAALVQHSCVCQGYSVAFYRLMLECGIDCRIVSGTAEYDDGSTILHSWNIVKLGDVYYDIDVTWDDDNSVFTYFMKCDDEFPHHVRDEEYSSDEFCSEYPMSSDSLLS